MSSITKYYVTDPYLFIREKKKLLQNGTALQNNITENGTFDVKCGRTFMFSNLKNCPRCPACAEILHIILYSIVLCLGVHNDTVQWQQLVCLFALYQSAASPLYIAYKIADKRRLQILSHHYL
jgi:hypothetical protein